MSTKRSSENTNGDAANINELIKAAEDGNALAQADLASSYITGTHGVQTNFKEAIKLYRKSVEQDCPQGCCGCLLYTSPSPRD